MSKLKKFFFSLIALIYIMGCLSGCTPAGTSEHGGAELKIITTIFPEYDWVRNVLGDNPAQAQLTLLLDSGADLHSYQPTASDLLGISTCDLFIFVGGESDKWVKDALKSAVNKDMTVINLLETLGDSLKEEETVEGMQESGHDHDHEGHDGEEHDHDHEGHDGEGHDHEDHNGEEHDHDHENHDEDEVEYDEHVWLSLRNAGIFVNTVASALQKLDPANASSYKKNADAYIERLNDLDKDYKKTVDEAPVKTLLFGDRFPFRYLVDDYGLDYYAAFSGCSAETEASFATVTFLAQKLDALSLPSVLTIERSDQKIAKAIIDSTRDKDRNILTLDSLQSVTRNDIESGVTYLSVMENNLCVLKEALK
ncbi:MAG: zinc ABC transporter substrate-binding protein [Lachnospiraceae bacterium]|nr:zinc ABC transporter substrate-binding protein [Lachnospiraceae bacterium]